MARELPVGGKLHTIEVDKPNNPACLQWALALSMPGTVILGDDVVRGGAILEAHPADARVQGVRR